MYDYIDINNLSFNDAVTAIKFYFLNQRKEQLTDQRALEKLKLLLNSSTNPKAANWKDNWANLCSSYKDLQSEACGSSKEKGKGTPTNNNVNIYNSRINDIKLNTTVNQSSDFNKKRKTQKTKGKDTRISKPGSSQEFASNQICESKSSQDSAEAHPRRLKVYLLKNVNRDCQHKGQKWYLNKKNISSLLASFRSYTLQLYDKHHDLNDNRLLALQYIYPVTETFGDSTLKFIGRSDHSDLVKVLRQDYSKEVVITENMETWTILASNLNNNSSYWDIFDFTSQCTSEARTSKIKEEIVYSSCLFSLLPNLTNAPSEYEDTYVHFIVAPWLLNIFGHDAVLKQEGANVVLSALKDSKYTSFYKPDHLVSVMGRKTRFDIFITEVKHPKKANVGNISDFVKLLREMKISLNHIIRHKVMKSPRVFGALVAGDLCKTFVMDIKFDKTYRVTQLHQFQLINGFEKTSSSLKVFKPFMELKEMVLDCGNEIEENELLRGIGMEVEIDQEIVDYMTIDDLDVNTYDKK